MKCGLCLRCGVITQPPKGVNDGLDEQQLRQTEGTGSAYSRCPGEADLCCQKLGGGVGLGGLPPPSCCCRSCGMLKVVGALFYIHRLVHLTVQRSISPCVFYHTDKAHTSRSKFSACYTCSTELTTHTAVTPGRQWGRATAWLREGPWAFPPPAKWPILSCRSVSSPNQTAEDTPYKDQLQGLATHCNNLDFICFPAHTAQETPAFSSAITCSANL